MVGGNATRVVENDEVRPDHHRFGLAFATEHVPHEPDHVVMLVDATAAEDMSTPNPFLVRQRDTGIDRVVTDPFRSSIRVHGVFAPEILDHTAAGRGVGVVPTGDVPVHDVFHCAHRTAAPSRVLRIASAPARIMGPTTSAAASGATSATHTMRDPS